MKYKMTLPSGLVLDFTNMFGTDRLQDEEVALSLETIGAAAAAAVDSLRATGRSKAHLSKDGMPEHARQDTGVVTSFSSIQKCIEKRNVFSIHFAFPLEADGGEKRKRKEVI